MQTGVREEIASNAAGKISDGTCSSSINTETELSLEEGTSALTLFIRSSDVRQGDVLCRRGKNDNLGNARFCALVNTRKDEYVKARKGEAKTKIAQEIIDAIKPGRFLQPVEYQDLWKQMDNDAMLEKVKLALRQKPRKRKTKKDEATEILISATTSDALVETITAPTFNVAEQHPLQLDEQDIFSPIDMEAIDTDVDLRLSFVTENGRPVASSPTNLVENINFSSTVAPQQVGLQSIELKRRGTVESIGTVGWETSGDEINPLGPMAPRSLMLNSEDDLWEDCMSLEADALDLDQDRDVDWDLSGVSGAIEDSSLPVFTPQDEIVEQANLTPPEIIDIVADLRGITEGLTNLRLKDPTAQPPRPVVLSRLEDELSMLPAERKEAYCQAVLKCPGLVSDERKMAFLEREDGYPARAAARLALYWELRLETFGPERCFLPMTLNGAMRDEVENMVRWPIHQLLPVKDTAGRAIWYFDPSHRDFDNYSMEQELMALWYILEVASEEPEALKQGYVFVSNWKDVKMRHLFPKDKRSQRPGAARIKRIAEDALPIPPRALHFCHPNVVFSYLLPVFKYMFGKKGRQRTQVHRGSEVEVLQELEEFCLPKDRVPTELGGEVVLDMAKFLANRTTVESSRSDPRLVLDQDPISTPKGPASKRSRRGSTSAEANASDEADAPIVSIRGKPDPRMARAVDIKLTEPELSLHDVLLKAGYTFDFKNESGEPIGPDQTSLKQRKNNLCRRVRQEKLRRKAQGANTMEPRQVTSTNTSTTQVAAVFADDSPSDAATPKLGITRSRNMPVSTCNDVENDHDDHSSSGESVDSFYESILALPDTDVMPLMNLETRRAA